MQGINFLVTTFPGSYEQELRPKLETYHGELVWAGESLGGAMVGIIKTPAEQLDQVRELLPYANIDGRVEVFATEDTARSVAQRWQAGQV